MQVTVSIPANQFAVLTLFAAVEDKKRPQLTAIFFELTATEYRAVATDGAILGAFRGVFDEPEIESAITFLVPSSTIRQLGLRGGLVALTFDTETGLVELAYQNLKTQVFAVDLQFPAWRRVVPEQVTGEIAQFDGKYLTLLAKAWKALKGPKEPYAVGIGHNGSRAALLDFNDCRFAGVLMPLVPGVSKVLTPILAPRWVHSA